MRKTTKLVLTGGKKPQQRKASRKSWTKKKAEDFLTVLADTCNVSEACRQSGVSSGVAYQRRKTDAGFRAGWNEALSTAYRRLELVLLDRAFNGTEKVVTRRDGSEERVREYSDTLGLNLLKFHQATVTEAEAEPSSADVEELRERVLIKLKRLKARHQSESQAT